MQVIESRAQHGAEPGVAGRSYQFASAARSAGRRCFHHKSAEHIFSKVNG